MNTLQVNSRKTKSSFDTKAKTSRVLILISACFIAALLHIISVSKYGLALSGDSLSYFFASESFLSIGKMLFFNGSVYSDWPPLYPFFLAMINIATNDINKAAEIINIISIVGSLIIFFKLINNKVQNNILFACSMIIAVFAAPNYYVGLVAWTEPVFNLFVLIFIYNFDKFYSLQSKKHFIFAILSAILASLTRYSGIIILVTAFLILLFNNKYDFYNRIKKSFLFGLTTSLPILFWMIRNFILTNTFSGENRIFESQNILTSIKLILIGLADWFLPMVQNIAYFSTYKSVSVPLVLFLILFSFTLSIFIYKITRFKIDYSIIKNNIRKTTSKFVIYFSLLYIIFIFLSCHFQLYTAQNNMRFLSVIFYPFLIIIVPIIDHFLKISRKGSTWPLFLVFLIWAFSLIYFTGFTIDKATKYGAGGYNSDIYQKSPTVNWLKSNILEIKIWTNDYLAIKYTMDRNAYSITEYDKEIITISNMIDINDSAIVVLFNNSLISKRIQNQKVTPKWFIKLYKEFPDSEILIVKGQNR